EADVAKLGLWCTYHPGEVSLESFVRQCGRLEELGVPHSVGCVGLEEHLPHIEALRAALPPSTYVWVNAFKSQPDYYDESLLAALEAIDPLFSLNAVRHLSRSLPCRTGESVITVD